jgi:hypothetical protein
VTSVSGLKPQLLVVRRKLGQSAIAGFSSISSVTGTKPGSAAVATPPHIVTSAGQKQDRRGKTSRLRPSIDRTFAMDEIVHALQLMASKNFVGKIVVRV